MRFIKYVAMLHNIPRMTSHVHGLFVQNLLLQALVVGETTSSSVGESVSSATAALMGQVPPPHFCSTVVRLIVLQILAIGVSMSHFNVYVHVGG
jgi:hypothetical protein